MPGDYRAGCEPQASTEATVRDPRATRDPAEQRPDSIRERTRLVEVDSDGILARVRPWSAEAQADAEEREQRTVVDVRPLIVMPGLVDLHLHLPQFPNAGLGAGLDLLTWLEPLHLPAGARVRRGDRRRAGPALLRALARGRGTTTVARLRRHLGGQPRRGFPGGRGARHPRGAGQGDDGSLPLRRRPARRRGSWTSACPVAATCIERWHGRDDGRLRYAVTPRFAVSCSAEMLRESAELARSDRRLLADAPRRGPRRDRARSPSCSPKRVDYMDVYDRAGGLGPRTILAHADPPHRTARSTRIVETGTRIAHCPSSNLFLASGVMPLARYLERGHGRRPGLGRGRRAGRSASSRDAHRLLRQNAVADNARRDRPSWTAWTGCGWGRSRVPERLGSRASIGSLEAGKEADFICVDPRPHAAGRGDGERRTIRPSS